MNNKKSSRYGTNDANSIPKPEKIVLKQQMVRKNLNQSQNKSLESQKRFERYNEHIHSVYVDEFDEKNRAIYKYRKSRQEKEFLHSVKNLEGQGTQNHQNIKANNRQQGSNEKQLINSKSRQFFYKHPEWLKAKKRENEERMPSSSKYLQQRYKIEQQQTDINSTATNRQIAKIRSQSTAFLRDTQQIGGRITKNAIDHISNLEERSNRRVSKIEYLEITNIKLEEEIKQLKQKLQNLHDDNNILTGRMQTLEAELSSSNKKIIECNARQDHYRVIQIKLREKIEDLESKLLQANNQINTKNQLYDSGYNEGFSYSINYDREVLQKKNQQISRLNEIVTKTRIKVNQLNHFLSQERINNVQNLKGLQQKYEFLLQKKETQIKDLKKIIEARKEKCPIINMQARRATDNQMLQKTCEQSLKRVVSANFLHKDKFCN